MKNLSLRVYFGASLCVGIFLVALVSVALWIASDRLRDTAIEMQDSVESLTTAQDIRVSLDAHRRQSLLDGALDAQHIEARRQLEEKNLFTGIRRSKKWISSDGEHVIIQHAEVELENYIAESRRLREKGLTGFKLFTATSVSYERATSAVQDLIDINVAQALKSHSQAASQGRVFKQWVVAAYITVFLSIAILFWFFSRYIYRPLLNLRDIIGSYSGGRVDEPVLQSPSTVTEIREIASSFAELSLSLKRQNEQRLTFMTAVAHDLKNPLGAIEMSLGLLEPDANGEVPASERRELSSLMQRQINQLKRLVDDIMDAARIESGRLELLKQPSRIHLVVEDSVKIFRSLSAAHRIFFQTDSTADSGYDLVDCDPHRIGQVISNFLSNAIKYSPGGGSIEVSVQPAHGDEVLVCVSDEGIGIPQGELSGIFEPYRRAKSSREQIPGVGLGLSTAKKIIEAHGGRIEVVSRVGEGTTFKIYLPRIKETMAPKSHEPPGLSELSH